MSVHRHLPDLAPKGAECRFMTQNGHSAFSRFLPLANARAGVWNLSTTPKSRHGVGLMAMSTMDALIRISQGSLMHGSIGCKISISLQFTSSASAPKFYQNFSQNCLRHRLVPEAMARRVRTLGLGRSAIKRHGRPRRKMRRRWAALRITLSFCRGGHFAWTISTIEPGREERGEVAGGRQ